MPDESRIELSKYRLEKALSMLETAKRDLQAGDCASANNRAYYCFFHLMRAVLALDGLDFKRHSGVISAFNKNYVKTGYFARSFGKIILNASYIRTRSDYEDFYVCSVPDTEQLVIDAESFYRAVTDYLEKRYQGQS